MAVTDFTGMCKRCRKRLSVHRTHSVRAPQLYLTRHVCVNGMRSHGDLIESSLKNKKGVLKYRD